MAYHFNLQAFHNLYPNIEAITPLAALEGIWWGLFRIVICSCNVQSMLIKIVGSTLQK